MPTSAKRTVASNLAAALLAGVPSRDGMVRRAAQAWGGQSERWLRPLVRKVLGAFEAGQLSQEQAPLTAFLLGSIEFSRAWPRSCQDGELPLSRVYWVKDVMAPTAGRPASWQVPPLTSPGQLAEWLDLDLAQLDWLADCQGRTHRASGPLQHYTYRWLLGRKRKARLLEVPKAKLKAVQRRLLHELLDHIPPHHSAHGYRRARSIATYVAPHAGRRVVLHFDLRHFFPSLSAARVHALFRTAGYPVCVARLLTGLCTHAVSEETLRTRPAQAEPLPASAAAWFLSRHLPQGAPTSPALANLCAYRLDCRLAALSQAVGAQYTRYADDLVFSGDEVLERCVRRFHVHVCRIALEEGFEINTRKSHFMRQGVRQQVAGIVLNVRPNVPRAEFDRLKATLTNCLRHGPRTQNRDGHADFRAYLAGRIAYLAMINPSRGERLRGLLEQIRWEESGDEERNQIPGQTQAPSADGDP